MSSEEKILTIKDGKIIDAQIEDALSMLEVAPAIWGFDNDGIYMAAYNSALNLVRQDIQQHKNLKDKYAKMKIELFSWRVCWALFGLFLVGVWLLGFLFG